MTIELFLTFLTAGSAVSSLIVQAFKKTFKNIPNNILALISSVCVGTLGSLLSYLFMDIPFDAKNIISAILLGIAMWVGSCCGYDKVMQTIVQFKRG